MTDPYRIDDAASARAVPGTRRPRPGRRLRATLWGVIVVGLVGNGVTSLSGFHPAVSLCFGLVTVSGIIALIVHHVRSR